MKNYIDQANQPISRLLGIAALVTPSFLLVLAIWLPFGGSLIGNIEEWGLLGVFSTNGPFYFTTPHSPLPAHALRPLTVFPQAIAYNLDPYSFKYWNILLALSVLFKGVALTYITKWVTRSWYWGIAAGLLLIVYPADTMQLSFRSLHINWALAGSLLGLAGLLKALIMVRRPGAIAIAALSSALFGFSCSMYEASLLLAPAPLLIVFARHDFTALFDHLKRNIWVHLIWFGGPLAYILYVVRTAPLVKSYQSTLSGQHAVDSVIAALPHLFNIGLLRTLLAGWYDAIQMTATELTSYSYVVVVVISLVLSSALLLRKLQSDIYQTRTLQASKLLTIGVVLAMLGYAPYLLSLPHQSISQRTFLFATPGGVLAWIAVLTVIHQLSRYIAASVIIAFLGFGFATQIYQFHHYVNLGKREQQILQSIAAGFDGNNPGKTILVLDNTNQLNNTWMFIKENLIATMNYMYGKNVGALEICHMPSLEWQQSDSIARKGRCEERDKEWVFHYPTPVSGPGVASTAEMPDKHISKQDLIVLSVDPDAAGHVKQARPSTENVHFRKVYDGVVAPPASGFPLVTFRDQQRSADFHWNFGNWWSLDLPTPGSGWREPEWTVGLFHYDASAWKAAPAANILFDLRPAQEPYTVIANFTYIVPKIKASLRFEVNGKLVDAHWINDMTLGADFDASLLKDGENEVDVISDVDDAYYGLSARMTSLIVAPSR